MYNSQYLLKKDSTLKKWFDRIGKPIIRENYVGELFMKNGLLYQKHQEMKTGNQLVVPKGLQQQVMSVNHESEFSVCLQKLEYSQTSCGQDCARTSLDCDVCQRTVKKVIVKKLPLGSMPLIYTVG